MFDLDKREEEVRLIPNGDSKVVQLDDNPTRYVKIRSIIHSNNIDPNSQCRSQRRKKQSSEKAIVTIDTFKTLTSFMK